MRRILTTAVTLTTLAISAANASTLVNFGDSLGDGGNAQVLTVAAGGTWPTALYPNGQFTNGDTWATQLGLSPSLLGGTNFAYGGARAVENGDPIPDLFAQIGSYLGSGLSAEVATIWIGGNDFLALPDNPTFSQVATTIGNVVGTISLGVKTLALSGIDEILVFGLPDLGLLPDVASDPTAAASASIATGVYNTILEGALGFLDGALPASVGYFDTESLFREVVSMVPADLVSVPCIADPADCAANPDDYVFYDTIHPTEWVHTYLAEAVAQELGRPGPSEVPLPATAPLLLAGLGGLVLWSRRRRSPA